MFGVDTKMYCNTLLFHKVAFVAFTYTFDMCLFLPALNETRRPRRQTRDEALGSESN